MSVTSSGKGGGWLRSWQRRQWWPRGSRRPSLSGPFPAGRMATCASSQKKLQQAKEKDPQYQYSMGAVYLNNNNLDEAIRLFNKALSLDPRHFQSLNALGLTYSMKGDLQGVEGQRLVE